MTREPSASLFRRHLTRQVASFAIVVCLGIASLNVWEGMTSGSPYKIGMAIGMGLNVVLFCISILAQRVVPHRDDISLISTLAAGPCTLLTVLIFEAPTITMATVTGALAMLLFLPQVLHSGLIRLTVWGLVLGGCYITGLGVRMALRGFDLASSVAELIVLVCGPCSLIIILWMIVHSILIQKEALRQEIHEQNQELKRVNEVKSRFLANMSHELRTPLNAIIGYTELILEELEDTSDESATWNQDLLKVQDTSHHLLALIADVLDLSKVEASQMKVEHFEVSLTSFCQEVVELCKPLMLKHHNTLLLDLDIPDDMVIVTDRTKLRQILFNLLSNSAKFTSQGQVTLRVRQQDAAHLIISVSDTGIGIPESMKERLFEPFEQADSSTTRVHGGTGLGLTLVKALSVLLGGEVSMESQVQQGTTFYVMLPIDGTQDKHLH
tara:strand:+ start:1214 stop:2533 length:1320 start_codon:yes stop_codon:yes gene_type:complete